MDFERVTRGVQFPPRGPACVGPSGPKWMVCGLSAFYSVEPGSSYRKREPCLS
jgi:hypothetical protein